VSLTSLNLAMLLVVTHSDPSYRRGRWWALIVGSATESRSSLSFEGGKRRL
jgi:hypothetical protein